MTGRAITLVALMLVLLCVPVLVDAASLPDYFSGERVGALCLRATIPGLSTLNVLVQINFDKSTNGGITLARADSLFQLITTSITSFGGTLVRSCGAFKPSQIDSQFHLNALQVAQQLTGNYQSQGFQLYFILDAYNWTAPNPTTVDVLRADAFLVNGSNNVTYVGSVDILKSLVP